MSPKSDNREIERIAFLEASGYESWTINPLTADASFRRYFRLGQCGESVLLMDAPPPQENVGRFQLVAEHLIDCGIRVPRTYASNKSRGFLIVEDFGNDTFTRLLDRGENPETLYTMAVDALIRLHKNDEATDIAIEAYDSDIFNAEADLFIDWYYPAAVGKPACDVVRDSYYEAWNCVWRELPPISNPTLALRDYHVANVMRVGRGINIENCGLLDFQDALIGPQCFDLMSLLEDARRDVPGTLIEKLLTRYKHAMADRLDPGFDSWFVVTAAHRHMRVLGVFVRLSQRDAKPVYLSHLPRVAELLESHHHQLLSPVYNWLDTYLPNLAESALRLSHPANGDQKQDFHKR